MALAGMVASDLLGWKTKGVAMPSSTPSVALRFLSRYRWALASVALGILGLYASYVLQDSQWWSSTLMTVSGAVLLVGPLTFFAKKIEERTEGSLNEMEGRFEELRRTVAEGQKRLGATFEDALNRRKDALARSQSDEGFEASHEALMLMAEAGVLSSVLGARARIPNSPHYLRLVPKESSIRVVIDDVARVNLVDQSWAPGRVLSEVMAEVAAEMKASSEWLGEKSFDYATAFAAIGQGLILFDRFHHEGVLPGVAFFEDVGDGWYLTDCAIEHAPQSPYEITYDRLDEQDWYKQLRNKVWVNSEYSDRAIDQANVIRDLLR